MLSEIDRVLRCRDSKAVLLSADRGSIGKLMQNGAGPIGKFRKHRSMTVNIGGMRGTAVVLGKGTERASWPPTTKEGQY